MHPVNHPEELREGCRVLGFGSKGHVQELGITSEVVALANPVLDPRNWIWGVVVERWNRVRYAHKQRGDPEQVPQKPVLSPRNWISGVGGTQ